MATVRTFTDFFTHGGEGSSSLAVHVLPNEETNCDNRIMVVSLALLLLFALILVFIPWR
jgi:hypothetical protein